MLHHIFLISTMKSISTKEGHLSENYVNFALFFNEILSFSDSELEPKNYGALKLL